MNALHCWFASLKMFEGVFIRIFFIMKLFVNIERVYILAACIYGFFFCVAFCKGFGVCYINNELGVIFQRYYFNICIHVRWEVLIYIVCGTLLFTTRMTLNWFDLDTHKSFFFLRKFENNFFFFGFVDVTLISVFLRNIISPYIFMERYSDQNITSTILSDFNLIHPTIFTYDIVL